MRAAWTRNVVVLFGGVVLAVACGDRAFEGGEAGEVASEGPAAYCGDQLLLQRYSACSAAPDEQTCVALGGWWAVWTSAGGTCTCSAGQDGCPCRRASDCLGVCATESECAGGCEGTCGDRLDWKWWRCEIDEQGIAVCPDEAS